MTATEEAVPEPPVSIDTVAAWRRRRQACEEPVLPPPPDEEAPPDEFQRATDAVSSDSLDTIGAVFHESQRAGLDVMLSLSRAATPVLSLPANDPAPSLAARPSAPDNPS